MTTLKKLLTDLDLTFLPEHLNVLEGAILSSKDFYYDEKQKMLYCFHQPEYCVSVNCNHFVDQIPNYTKEEVCHLVYLILLTCEDRCDGLVDQILSVMHRRYVGEFIILNLKDHVITHYVDHDQILDDFEKSTSVRLVEPTPCPEEVVMEELEELYPEPIKEKEVYHINIEDGNYVLELRKTFQAKNDLKTFLLSIMD